MLTIFALNTDKNDKVEFLLDLRSFGSLCFVGHRALFNENLSLVNSPDMPDTVRPVSLETEKAPCNAHTVILEKASWNVMRFKIETKT
jgi:alpha-L-arabinofuranosidase